MTPTARASAGLVPAGMFRASTLPRSMSVSRGGKVPAKVGRSVGGASSAAASPVGFLGAGRVPRSRRM